MDKSDQEFCTCGWQAPRKIEVITNESAHDADPTVEFECPQCGEVFDVSFGEFEYADGTPFVADKRPRAQA